MSLFWPLFMSVAMSERESYSPNTSVYNCFLFVLFDNPTPSPPNFISPFIGEFRGGGYGGVFEEVLHGGREIGGWALFVFQGAVLVVGTFLW